MKLQEQMAVIIITVLLDISLLFNIPIVLGCIFLASMIMPVIVGARSEQDRTVATLRLFRKCQIYICLSFFVFVVLTIGAEQFSA